MFSLLRGDAVAWLDPRGPFQKQDGSRGTGPYLMYARSEDKDTNRRRFACAHHGCRVTLTADMVKISFMKQMFIQNCISVY